MLCQNTFAFGLHLPLYFGAPHTPGLHTASRYQARDISLIISYDAQYDDDLRRTRYLFHATASSPVFSIAAALALIPLI